jgi:hypothetical protein
VLEPNSARELRKERGGKEKERKEGGRREGEKERLSKQQRLG